MPPVARHTLLLLLAACRPTPDDPVDPAARDTAVEQVPEAPGADDGNTDWFFDPTRVLALDLGLPAASLEALEDDPATYVEGTLAFPEEGITLDGVGVRLKGMSTWRDLSGKASFKVKLDFLRDGQVLHGERRLTLDSLVYDPSMLAPWLAYEAWRGAGAPAPRVGFATVAVNGEPYGLYALVESYDEVFLGGWFDDPTGPIWEAGAAFYPCDFDKCTCFELDEPGSDTDTADLEALCAAVTAPPGEAWPALQALLDVDAALRYLALEMVVGHWDGYAFNVNNYHFTRDPGAGRWSFLPWSTDLAWAWNPWMGGGCGSWGADLVGYDRGLLAATCAGDPTCAAALADAVRTTADLLERQDLPARIPALRDLLAPHVAEDPRREYDVASYDAQVACLAAFLAGRPAQVRALLGDGA